MTNVTGQVSAEPVERMKGYVAMHTSSFNPLYGIHSTVLGPEHTY
jgi:hypothetical protein